MSHTPRIPSDVSDFHNELECLQIINDSYLTQSIGNLEQLLLYIYMNGKASVYTPLYIYERQKTSVYRNSISLETRYL